MTPDAATELIAQLATSDLQVVLRALCRRIEHDHDVLMAWIQVTPAAVQGPNAGAGIDYMLQDVRDGLLRRGGR